MQALCTEYISSAIESPDPDFSDLLCIYHHYFPTNIVIFYNCRLLKLYWEVVSSEFAFVIGLQKVHMKTEVYKIIESLDSVYYETYRLCQNQYCGLKEVKFHRYVGNTLIIRHKSGGGQERE